MLRTGSLLITGANRGIGLETVRQLVAMETGPKIIFACSRNPENAKAFLPLLKKAAERSTIKGMAWNKAAILNISSQLGSIALNTGLYISYGACKAALNHLSRSISFHVKNSGIMSTVLHPEWVKTDMGGPSAPLEVVESVKDLLKVFLKLDSESTGKFIDFQGGEIPW